MSALHLGRSTSFDVGPAIEAWGHYMGQLRRYWRSLPDLERHWFAAGSYNARPGNIRKAFDRCGRAPTWSAAALCLPAVTGTGNARQTTDYVRRIQLWSQPRGSRPISRPRCRAKAWPAGRSSPSTKARSLAPSRRIWRTGATMRFFLKRGADNMIEQAAAALGHAELDADPVQVEVILVSIEGQEFQAKAWLDRREISA